VTARERQVAELRAQALDLRARGYAALDAGDGRLAQELLDRAILRDETADLLEAGEGRGLPAVPRRRMMGHMEAPADTRGLKIAKSKTAKGRAPEVQALYDAGLTPATAAEACGTTRDVLKQAWAKGSQFRPIRPEWAKKLAAKGVPIETWRQK
jgi:hypothetical protein